MPGTWFIGDTHFGHAKVSEIRGFSTTEDHDNAIRRKWLRQVAPDDLVYVLGDLSSGSSQAEVRAVEFIGDLPGRKRLICGNHDSVSGIHRRPSPNARYFRNVFESINDYGRIRIDGTDILLSHYPYASQGDGPGRGEARYVQYRLPDLGAPLIHAHTHNTHPTSGSLSGRELCVSWDAWRRLVNIGDIARWVAEIETPED